MDVNSLQSFIDSVGFPIVCVIGLGIFIMKVWNRMQEANDKREEKLYSFITTAQANNEELTKSNAGFVEVLRNYDSYLEDIKGDLNDIKIKLEERFKGE